VSGPRPGLVSAFDHVSLLVDDLGAARQFYVDVLGCQEVPRPDLGFPGAWLAVGGTACIHLLALEGSQDAGSRPAEPTGFAYHVALSVDDLARARRRLTALGYDVREGQSGITQLFLQDPSGNVIELIERK
jgi:glyoxylase I family protein